MADLEAMSNEELLRLVNPVKVPASIKEPPKPPRAMEEMSDAELLAVAGVPHEEAKGILSRAADAALAGIAAVGRTVDSYTGAPARAAIGAMQEGGGLTGAVRRYMSQFGENPDKAPTGEDIARKAGFSPEGYKITLPAYQGGNAKVVGFEDKDIPQTVDIKLPSPAAATGFGIDVLADPTNLIPATAVIRGAANTAKSAAVATKEAALSAGRKLGIAAYDAAKTSESPLLKGAANTAEGVAAIFEKVHAPEIASDWKEYAAIAEKNGISPDLLSEEHKYGSHSLIARAARQQRADVLGEKSFEKFKQGLDQTRDAVETKISEIGKGAPLGPVDAGEYIRKSYDDAYHEFFNKIENSYDQVIKDYPGLELSDDAMAALESKLNGVEKFAKGRVARGVTEEFRSQGKGLINSVDAIRNSNGSVKQMVEALRDIGEAAFSAKNSLATVPPDVKRLRQLYGDITEAIHTTIQQDVKNGQAVSDSLKAANQKMTEWFGEKSIVADIIGDKGKAPEKVFNSLILSGDTRKIDALRFIIGDDRMQAIKGAALQDLFDKSIGKDGLMFGTLRTNLKQKRNVLGSLLEPQEAADFNDLVRLGDRFGNPVLSSSETAAGVQFAGMHKEIPRNALNQATLEGLKKRAAAAEVTGIRIPKEATGIEPTAPGSLPGRIRSILSAPIISDDRALIDVGAKASQVYQTTTRKKKEGVK